MGCKNHNTAMYHCSPIAALWGAYGVLMGCPVLLWGPYGVAMGCLELLWGPYGVLMGCLELLWGPYGVPMGRHRRRVLVGVFALEFVQHEWAAKTTTQLCTTAAL